MSNLNAANPKQVKRAAQQERFDRRQQLEDMRAVLETPSGRRFVWRYLGTCGVFETSFTGNSTTFFNEGKRQIGLQLLADVNEARPEAYLEMRQEAMRTEEAGKVLVADSEKSEDE